MRLGRLSVSLRDDLFHRILVFWVITFVGFGPMTLQAATYYVDAAAGSDSDDGLTEATAFETITHALSMAAGNADATDTIIVLPGLYDTANGETFPLALVDGVSLESRDGAATTTISAPAGTSVFENNGTVLGPGTALEGFTLEHDDDPSALADISMLFSSAGADMAPRIENNVFIGVSDPISGDDDAGVFIDLTGGGSFTGTISNNSFTGFGLEPSASLISPSNVAAIVATTGDTTPVTAFTPLISNNTFTANNTAVAAFFPYSYVDSFAPVIDQNTFDTNGIDITFYNIYTGLTSGTTITSNTSSAPTRGISIIEVPIMSTPTQTTISGNELLNVAGDVGVLLYSLPDSEHTITMTDNTVVGGNLIGIYTIAGPGAFSNTPVSADLTVSNNSVTGMTAPTSPYSPYSYALPVIVSHQSPTGYSDTIVISNNTVSDNQGLGIHAVFYGSGSYTPTDPQSVTVERNLVENNGYYGLFLQSQAYSTTSTEVRCNAILDNGGDGVWQRDQPDPNADLGTSLDPGLNTIYGNGGGTGNYDLRNDDADPMTAEGNYWGTTDLPTIDSHIYDDDEDAESGAVDFDPPLAEDTLTSCAPGQILATIDLVATKEANPSTVEAGRNVEYTITVSNNGTGTATNVVITDVLPAQTTFFSASAGCTESGGTVTCNVGDIDAGETITRSIVVTVNLDASGEFENTAVVTADQVDATPADNAGAATVTAQAVIASIPTASEWGLIIMTILLSFAGALMLIRRGGGSMLAILIVAAALTAAPLHAANSGIEAASLTGVAISGDDVTLTFEGREPLRTTRDRLHIRQMPPSIAQGTSSKSRIRTQSSGNAAPVGLLGALTPEQLAAIVGGSSANVAALSVAGTPLVLTSGESRYNLTIVRSHEAATRLVAMLLRAKNR